jgi:hypothetical protein
MALIDSAAPPRASPSSLVRITPVSARRSWKACADFTASWPVIASTTSSLVVRLRAARDLGDFRHHLVVDVQAAGGVEDHEVEAVLLRVSDAARAHLGRGDAFDVEHGHADLRAQDTELLDGRGTLDVGRDEQRTALVLLLEKLGELRAGRGLARALQAGHQDHGRPDLANSRRASSGPIKARRALRGRRG